MEEKDITSTFLMKQILDELNHLKTNMPNGELKHLQTSMEDLKKDQKSMKDDISDMKKKLLDPETGVIVKVNENTKFRLAEENRNLILMSILLRNGRVELIKLFGSYLELYWQLH